MEVKVMISMALMVVLLGTLETRVLARREMEEEPSSEHPKETQEQHDDPELTVEELCAKTSNASTCINNFGSLVKDHGKARVSYYLDEGAKMARDELTKAYQVMDTLKPKAQQSPNAQYLISCLEGCKHNIDQALDRLGGEPIGQAEGGGGGGGSSGDGNKSSAGDSDSDTNLFFSDALTDTTTCLDELKMGEDPEVFKGVDDALRRAREIIRNLLGISHILS